MEIVAREQGLALLQLFPYKFSLYSNLHKISFKLGHFDVFDMPFPFLAFLKLQPIIL